MAVPVFRFAPSPNGPLHLGHALSALTGYAMAKRLGGRFLVRIEDIDTGRTRGQFVEGIFEDLAWLGLTWEQPVLVQSQHFPDYLAVSARLVGQGLLYPCFATRTEIAAAADPARLDPDGVQLYPGLWKGARSDVLDQRLGRGETPALRIDMAKALVAARAKLSGSAITFTEIGEDGVSRVIEAHPERWGDAVIVRRDVPASYHLAVVVDDARQGVTHVTRGQDLFAATDLHRLLQVLLGYPAPLYSHHRLVTGPDGQKLSKSLGDASLKALREAGASAAKIREMLGFG